MEELGDAEKYSFGIFYNNVRVYVERMPGNPRLITMMQVYDAINNKSATVDLIEPVFEENHEGKRSVCTRLVEMAGRTRQNTDYRLEKNASVTVSCRKDNYCMSQLNSQPSGMVEEDAVTKKAAAFKAAFDAPSGLSAILGEEGPPLSLFYPNALPAEGAMMIMPPDKENETGDEEEGIGEESSFVFGSYNGRKSAAPKQTVTTAKKSKTLSFKSKKKALLPYTAGKKQP